MASGGKRAGAGRPRAPERVSFIINQSVLDKDPDVEFAKLEPILLHKIIKISSKDESEITENEMSMLPLYTKLLEYFKVKADKRPPKKDEFQATAFSFDPVDEEMES